MTEEDIWKGDLLGRKEEGKYLQRYIENLYKLDKKDQTSFVLNINSEWGHGKTWFLQRLKSELSVNHPVVYFDAWKNDFSNDALLSFVSVVCDELSKLYWKKGPISQKITKVKTAFSSISRNALPILISILAKQLTGKALEDLVLSNDAKELFIDASEQLSKVVSSSMIDGFITQKNAIDDFSNAIQSLVNEIKNDPNLRLPICIIIDELDRCRPTYAIELLEAVKHLFSIKGIFFVLATDTTQLCHSIRAVYGEGFNAEAYVKRFFYTEYVLSNPDFYQVANFLFDKSLGLKKSLYLPESLGGQNELSVFFAHTCKLFQLNIRDQEQVFYILEGVAMGADGIEIHFLLIMLLICLKQKHIKAYSELSVTRSSNQLHKFFGQLSTNGKLDNFELLGRMHSRERAYDQKFYIGDIFQYYCDLLDGDLDSSKIRRDGTGWGWQMDIGNNLFRNFRNQSGSGSHNLGTYFRLLDQSGRLL